MGIKFPCAHCGQRLNIKSDLAGKRGICPHCHAKIDIPSDSVPRVKSPTSWSKDPTSIGSSGSAKGRSLDDSDETTFDPAVPRTIPSVSALVPGQTTASTPTASASNSATQKTADPIDEAPELRWYVMPEGTEQRYGPAPGEVMRGWIADGRVGVDSLVWREDWLDWLEAAKVFPQLRKTSAPETSSPAPQPAASAPAAVSPAAMMNPQVRAQGAPAGVPLNPVAPGFTPAAAVVGARVPTPTAGPANAPLFKIDEPLRHLGPATEYIPSSKRSKTGALIAIIVLAVAMLVLVPVVVWVLTRQ